MRNTVTGWTMVVHGCGMYPDGTIDWDYSSGGKFEDLTPEDTREGGPGR